jgi:hypothetical protein
MGRQFAKPDSTRLVLGSATKGDVVALYGPAENEKTSIVSGEESQAKQARSEFDAAPVAGTFSYLSYHYSEKLHPLLGGDVSIKFANFVFWNGSLVAYDFSSSFSKESSNFDETRIAAIQKGKSTRSDVEQIMGPATGEAIYPSTLTQGNRKSIYSFTTLDVATSKVTTKHLFVLYGADGRVIDYRFDSGSEDLSLHPH